MRKLIIIYIFTVFYYLYDDMATVFANYFCFASMMCGACLSRWVSKIKVYYYLLLFIIIFSSVIRYFCVLRKLLRPQTKRAELSIRPSFGRSGDEFSCQNFLLARLKRRPNDRHISGAAITIRWRVELIEQKRVHAVCFRYPTS